MGLGVGNGSKANFAHDAIFSIFLNSNLTGGKLLFKQDTSTYAQPSSSPYTFLANSTWQIRAERGSTQIGEAASPFDGNLMFDINLDVIGLPAGTFKAFMDFVSSGPSIYCFTSGPGTPYCRTSKKLDDLADIIISINGSAIKVPSQIYAVLDKTTESPGYFYLQFMELSLDPYGGLYASPSFKNSTILGTRFMSYYHTVFDASGDNPVISLYSSINAPIPPPQRNLAKWISIGAAGVILLIGIWWCINKKRKTGAVAGMNHIIQDSLISNHAIISF